MIDLHSHILPEMDDGPKTLEESVEMCRIASMDGIQTMIATPHFRPGAEEFSEATISSRISELNSNLSYHGIEISILPGADVSISPELPLYLRRSKTITINRTGKYFLAELPNSVPARWDFFLLSLLREGYVPILTHPERNWWFLNNPQAIYPFVAAGGMVQITAMSITGGYGADIAQYCCLLLKHNLVHVIATDAHSVDKRPPILSKALAAASEIIGREEAMALVTSIPYAIVHGKPVVLPEPEAIIKKRTWIQKILQV